MKPKLNFLKTKIKSLDVIIDSIDTYSASGFTQIEVIFAPLFNVEASMWWQNKTDGPIIVRGNRHCYYHIGLGGDIIVIWTRLRRIKPRLHPDHEIKENLTSFRD